MIKVTHNHLKAAVFFTDQILNGYLNILEDDVGGTSGSGVARFDFLCLYAFSSLDEQQRDAKDTRASSTHGNGEVVASLSSGDPFLDTVNDIEFSARGLGRCAFDGSDVATRERLGDGQADLLGSVQALGYDSVSESRFGEVHNRRQANYKTGTETIYEARRSDSGDFFVSDHLVEVIEILSLKA